MLSVHKLPETLVSFTLYDERVEDIVTVLRYSYLNTPDLSETMNDLRLLVSQYAALVLESLHSSPDIRLLLEEFRQVVFKRSRFPSGPEIQVSANIRDLT
jgi:hypothetical protein